MELVPPAVFAYHACFEYGLNTEIKELQRLHNSGPDSPYTEVLGSEYQIIGGIVYRKIPGLSFKWKARNT